VRTTFVVSFPSEYGAQRENELGIFKKLCRHCTITSGAVCFQETPHWVTSVHVTLHTCTRSSRLLTCFFVYSPFPLGPILAVISVCSIWLIILIGIANMQGVYRNPPESSRRGCLGKNGYDSKPEREATWRSIFPVIASGKDPYEWQAWCHWGYFARSLTQSSSWALVLARPCHHDVSASQWTKKKVIIISLLKILQADQVQYHYQFSWINTEGIQVYLARRFWSKRWLLTWWIGAQLSLESMFRMLILIHKT